MKSIQVPHRNRFYIRVISLLFISGFCLLFYYNLVDRNLDSVSGIWNATNGEKLRTESVLEQDSKTVLVLIWTSFFGRKAVSNDGITFNRESYPNCFHNCDITDNRSKLDQADAVIFHVWDMNKQDLPTTRQNGQFWVMLEQESPFVARSNLDSFSGLFNWTMTYRMDSDVSHPYGAIDEIPDSIKHETKVRTDIDSLLSGKSKLVAGTMSRCQTKSNREMLVSQLKAHIPVEIYGKCGIRVCGHGAKNCSEDDFWKNITRQHKFFLAFENALCADYVTEKLFRTLELGIVPVVYGGANYTKFAPPHSFIDVSDFKSPLELANFLQKLDQNETEYRKYFEWRLKYRVKIIPGYCTLCKKLKKIGQKKLQGILPASKTYHNLKSWWFNYPPPVESLSGEKKIENDSNTTPSRACRAARY